MRSYKQLILGRVHFEDMTTEERFILENGLNQDPEASFSDDLPYGQMSYKQLKKVFFRIRREILDDLNCADFVGYK